MPRSFIALLFLTLALTLNACGSTTYARPADAVDSAASLFHHIEERAENVHAARVRAVMEYFGKDGRVRVRQALVVQNPQDLRLETLSPFDSTLSLVVANEDSLIYYDLQKDRIYGGSPTAENLAKLIPIFLSPKDIVDVVLGGVPLERALSDAHSWTLDWDKNKNAWKLSGTTHPGGKLHLWVRHNSWSLAGAMEQDAAGKTNWEIRTAEFRSVRREGVETEVPNLIRFLMPSQKLDVSLSVQEYTLNPTLADTLFEFFVDDQPVYLLDGPMYE